MSVYVDPLMGYHDSQIANAAKKHGSQWCHLTADSLDELHQFAQSIGLKRAWFQPHSVMPHYDLTPGKRAIAVRNGAIEISMMEAGRRIKEVRISQRGDRISSHTDR